MSLKKVVKKVIPDLLDYGIDVAFKAYDQRKRSPPETEGSPSKREVYGAEAKSFKGQSDIGYCIECSLKHSQTAKVLMREALQRAEAGKPRDPGVQEKVRGVVEELCGLEDDTMTVSSEMVSALNTSARELRKFIYTKGAEMGKASLEDLKEIKGMVDQLVEASYTVRAAEECPQCDVESVCEGNIECMQFLIDAADKAKSPEEWARFLEEAKEKYKQGSKD
jgi:DNA-directed RNA polymerase subunit F